GGAVYSNSAALVLDSCIFYDNVATDGDGGAVRADGGNVTIVGGKFLGNTASRYGGAVAATGAINSLVVKDRSKFDGNTALVGGALYCSGMTEGGLATFYGGGAVVFLFTSANITNSVFSSNHAQHSGGALLGGNGTDITVDGCTFENNTAVMVGGAIAAATMTLGGNSQLASNTATLSGGAV
ncbi:unnamed protein product, partial [Laminaria digitata]